ncbi:hypothetical protein ID866_8372 [Astraeus odoratus]|nr:hypothetical protein ID866_8372 [Astraeus odoratus]
MSDIKVEGFKVSAPAGVRERNDTTRPQASEIISRLSSAFEGFSDAQRQSQIKKVCFPCTIRLASSACCSRQRVRLRNSEMKANGIFELRITNGKKEEAVWTIDMKEKGTVYKGPAQSKPGVVLLMSDDTFALLAEGKLDGQKAFMTGKLKTKGNAMLATKLGPILEVLFWSFPRANSSSLTFVFSPVPCIAMLLQTAKSKAKL